MDAPPFSIKWRRKTSNNLIVLGEFNAVQIHARESDKYLDVTELCQTHGKELSEYLRSPSVIRFREALYASLEKSQAGKVELIIKTRSEAGQQGHTFADRRIALHRASRGSAPSSRCGRT